MDLSSALQLLSLKKRCRGKGKIHGRIIFSPLLTYASFTLCTIEQFDPAGGQGRKICRFTRLFFLRNEPFCVRTEVLMVVLAGVMCMRNVIYAGLGLLTKYLEQAGCVAMGLFNNPSTARL